MHGFDGARAFRIANGRFECTSVISASPISKVYRARDVAQGSSVVRTQDHQAESSSGSSKTNGTGLVINDYAVKCLDKDGCNDIQRNCQKREAALHARVSHHPNILTLYECIDVDAENTLYLILEHWPDGDLFHMVAVEERFTQDWHVRAARIGLGVMLGGDAGQLSQQQTLPPESRRNFSLEEQNYQFQPQQRQEDHRERARLQADRLIKHVFRQIIDAVRFCHAQGIFHRDIKPENILCRDGGTTIALADFGLATSEERSTDFSCGSAIYKSPDGLGGIYEDLYDYDTASTDVWALGVLLINLVCRRNPWKVARYSDPTFREYLQRHDVLLDILPISPQLNQVLQRVFTEDASDRCSVDELASQVDALPVFASSAGDTMEAVEAERGLSISDDGGPSSAQMSPEPGAVEARGRSRPSQEFDRLLRLQPSSTSSSQSQSRDPAKEVESQPEQAAQAVQHQQQERGQSRNRASSRVKGPGDLIPVHLHHVNSKAPG